jgi:hypothetical protein
MAKKQKIRDSRRWRCSILLTLDKLRERQVSTDPRNWRWMQCIRAWINVRSVDAFSGGLRSHAANPRRSDRIRDHVVIKGPGSLRILRGPISEPHGLSQRAGGRPGFEMESALLGSARETPSLAAAVLWAILDSPASRTLRTKSRLDLKRSPKPRRATEIPSRMAPFPQDRELPGSQGANEALIVLGPSRPSSSCSHKTNSAGARNWRRPDVPSALRALQRAGPVNYHNSRCTRTSRICEGAAITRLFSGNHHSHFLWVSNQR